MENENRRFQTFVANRIAIIRDRSDPVQWRFVDGTLNPADFASRGLTAVKFLKSNSWINGPDFLWKPRSSWPERPVSLQPNEVPSDDPELKRDIISCIPKSINLHRRRILFSTSYKEFLPGTVDPALS